MNLRRRAMRLGREAGNGWLRFWFEPANPLPLGVLRLLFGGLILYTHAIWGLRLDAFFGEQGWQPSALVKSVQESPFTWSFWWLVPAALRTEVHVASLVALLLFWLGAWTRITSIAAYLIIISYAYRAPMANFGLDQFNAIAALYLAIGPSGATLSIDRLRTRYHAARQSHVMGTAFVPPPIPASARANLAIRLLQVHLCVIYSFAGLAKLQGESWWNGEAIWQAAANLEYQSRDLTWLAWYPWLVNLLTHATILWELTFWSLVWKPALRPIVLAIGVAVHLGIGAFMGMWTFGLAAIFSYSSFVRATTFEALLRLINRPFNYAVQLLAATRFVSAHPKRIALCVALHEPPSAVFSMGPPVESDSVLESTPFSARPAEAPVQSALPTSALLSQSPKTEKPPMVLLVERRLKRQSEVQEYFIKRGFHCLAASDLQQALNLFAVTEVDALVVTSCWSTDAELASFRQSLIAGGEGFPGSVFLAKPDAAGTPSWQNVSRHRVLFGRVSLRQVRAALNEALGRKESLDRKRRSALASRNGSKPADPPGPSSTTEEAPERLDRARDETAIFSEHGMRT